MFDPGRKTGPLAQAPVKTRAATIIWPLGGLNRQSLYRAQPPFTTPDALNVRPVDAFESRHRGGSRPGCSKAYQEELGGGTPVRMLAQSDMLSDGSILFWSDNFNSQLLDPVWIQASWLEAKPKVRTYDGPILITEEDESGVVRSPLANFNLAAPYQIEMRVVPYLGRHHGTYRIFFRMDNNAPDVTDAGARVTFTIDGTTGDYSGTVDLFVEGVGVSYAMTGGSDGAPLSGILKLLVSGNNVLVFWNATKIFEQELAPAVGSRFGFGLRPEIEGGVCQIDYFRIQYGVTNPIERGRKILIASAGGVVYQDNTLGELEEILTALTLSANNMVMSAQRLQKLYIADYDDYKVHRTDGLISGAFLTSVGVSDFTALSISLLDDVVELVNATGNAVDGVYTISALTSGAISLSPSVGSLGTATFKVTRGPKIYDPKLEELSLYMTEAGKGHVPVGATIIARYRDRIVFGRDEFWWMSRQGNPYDFDFSSDDTDLQRAVAGSLSQAGMVGEPLTAIIPERDDYLIMATENTLWRLRGDPAYHGSLDNLSRNIGIVSSKAWCHVPNGGVLFLCKDGLYGMATSSEESLTSISRESIPEELLMLDPKIFDISMEYDIRDRGVHIYVTGKESGGGFHYWFDWTSKSFWPVALPMDHGPSVTLDYQAWDVHESAVLLGGMDGYVRKYHRMFVGDDATAITSYCRFGPIKVSGTDYFAGKLQELFGVLGELSGRVEFDVHTGDSSEASVKNDEVFTGILVPGLSLKFRPKSRGASLTLNLRGLDTFQHWSFEKMIAVFSQAGKLRRF